MQKRYPHITEDARHKHIHRRLHVLRETDPVQVCGPARIFIRERAHARAFARTQEIHII